MSASPGLNPRTTATPVRVAVPPSLRRPSSPITAATGTGSTVQKLPVTVTVPLRTAPPAAINDTNPPARAAAPLPIHRQAMASAAQHSTRDATNASSVLSNETIQALPVGTTAGGTGTGKDSPRARLPQATAPARLPAPLTTFNYSNRPSVRTSISAASHPPMPARQSSGNWFGAKAELTPHESTDPSPGYRRLGDSVIDSGSQYISLDATDGDANLQDDEGSKAPCRWRLWLLVFLVTSTIALLLAHFVIIPFTIRKIVASAPITINTIDIRNARPNDFDIKVTGTIAAGGGALNLAAETPSFTANVLYNGTYTLFLHDLSSRKDSDLN
jgi:hypothetical protein